jgi:hypothetical protein
MRTVALAFAVSMVACGGEATSTVAIQTPPSSSTTTTTPAKKTAAPTSEGDVTALAPLLPLWAFFGTGHAFPPAGDPQQLHRHDPTGTCMPVGIGPFALKNLVDTNADDRGVSMFDRNDRVILSLFTYPAGRSLEQEVQSIEASMCKGAGGAMQMDVGDPRFAEHGVVFACAHDTDYGPAIEQAVVFHDGKWFYESRFTFLQGALNVQYEHAMAAAQAAFRPCPPQPN